MKVKEDLETNRYRGRNYWKISKKVIIVLNQNSSRQGHMIAINQQMKRICRSTAVEPGITLGFPV